MFFSITHKDINTKARLGVLTTPHGTIQTPCFMPVGTQATVKALSPRDLIECQAEIVLSNTYHLFLRPGMEVIEKASGLHRFMSWDKPILTDSGGYQIFSLALLRKVRDEGVEFQSHIDGFKHFFSPEDVLNIQRILGSDIMMPLDECAHYPCARDYAQTAMERTIEWAKRSRNAYLDLQDNHLKQHLFGIVQGATYQDMRKECCQRIVDIGFDGYAIGGVSVGEPKCLLYEIIQYTAPLLPEESPHYVMGVGLPEDIVEAVSQGIDMFDCVIPTRYGRNGTAFTSKGKMIIRNAPFAEDISSLDPDCGCYTCTTFSRAYLRHLFNTDEMLGMHLVSLHNVYFFLHLMRTIRAAIAEGRFAEFKKKFLNTYSSSLPHSS